MASVAHQCLGVGCKACNHFLSAKSKDSHMHCTNCHDKCCTTDDRCVGCYDWTGEKWEKVSTYHEELAIQWKKKKKRKAKSFSSYF